MSDRIVEVVLEQLSSWQCWVSSKFYLLLFIHLLYISSIFGLYCIGPLHRYLFDAMGISDNSLDKALPSVGFARKTNSNMTPFT